MESLWKGSKIGGEREGGKRRWEGGNVPVSAGSLEPLGQSVAKVCPIPDLFGNLSNSFLKLGFLTLCNPHGFDK